MMACVEAQSKRSSRSRDRTISEPTEAVTDVLEEPRGRGMSLKDLKTLNLADEKAVKEKVVELKGKVRQLDRDRRRTTTIDRSALRPLPPTPDPLLPPIVSPPPRNISRTVTPARHQRVAGHPSHIPSRAREGHARSQSQGGNRASSAFFDSTDSLDNSRPSDERERRGFALPFNVPSLVRYILGRRNRSRSSSDLNNLRTSTRQRGIIKTPGATGLNRNRGLRHTVHFGTMDRPHVPQVQPVQKNKFAQAMDGLAKGFRRLSVRIRGNANSPSANGFEQLENESETPNANGRQK